MKLNFLFLFYFLIPILTVAQTVNISGKIIDEKGRKVENALIKIANSNLFTTSNSKGAFNIEVNENSNLTLIITALNYEQRNLNVQVQNIDVFMGTISITQKETQVVIVESKRIGTTIEKIKPPEIGVIPSSTGNFEDYLKLTGLGVTSNNELTSNYNVRGGNYDENLIYVNGIEIYRPLLARSGQQEGLSFINSAFVENIYFSAGGFDANYGDKLSSVLDVQYKEATKFKGSAQLSLMGAEFHIENVFGKANRGNFITGARYRTNAYVLNALPTKGDYFPNFFDYQTVVNYYTVYNNEDSYQKVFFLGHFAHNNYKFIPKTKTTQWGTVNEAYQLKIFYEGEENSNFNTVTGAIGYLWKVNKQLNFNLTTSAFYADENEEYDILGEYLINTLETDPSKEEFGDSTQNIGIGGFLNHARNNLDTWVVNTNFTSKYQLKTRNKNESTAINSSINWGLNHKYEQYNDALSEWNVIDSAGYIIPLDDDKLSITNLIKTSNTTSNTNVTSFAQYTISRIQRKTKILDLKQKIKTDSLHYYIYKKDTILNAPSNLNFTFGIRGGYRFFNNEPWLTPRFNMSFSPRNYLLTQNGSTSRRNVKFKFSSGLYFQPPSYREMRDLYGNVKNSVLAQKSWHNVLGMDVYVQMWGRPFKIVAETYYKHMWDINPYEIDNVKIRYYAENNAKAFAYGFDAKINGEFIKGVESHFKIGLLQIKEDLAGDVYTQYYNEAGEIAFKGYEEIADSAIIYPGYIPKQTEQLLTFSIFFQDKIPNFEDFKIAVNMQYGSKLPYGPPTFNRYQDILRSRAYFRVDLGIIYDFINAANLSDFQNKKGLNLLNRFSISLNAYNLLDFQNVVSYNWLQDISGRYYAIPNYLSGFRLNLKLVAEF